MTDLEQESLTVFTMVIEQMAIGHPFKRVNYKDFMARIRDIKAKLENKSFGCATGLHRGACDCKPAVLGKCLDIKKEIRG
jgi:hypothetical protein